MQSRWMLLAEDNDDDLALAIRAIKRVNQGVQVVVARDGHEAAQILGLAESAQSYSNPPELIVLDIKMPRIGGIEVLQKARSCVDLKLSPIVMMSSSDEPSDLRTCYELGANSYTVKPVVYEDFMQQVSSTVDYWLRINRIARNDPAS